MSVLLTAPAFAQSPAPPAPPAAMTADEEQPPDPMRLEESVEVTATRGTGEREMSPASSTLLLRSDIEGRDVTVLDKALTATEGVYAYRQRGVTDNEAGVGMRGFSGRGTGQARVLVMLDGQPLNNAYTGAVNWTGLVASDVDRVEVVRGPFSALYGGNAMGGVVNILTRPIGARSAEVAARFGTFGTQTYSGRAGLRVRDRLGLAFSFETLDTDGYPAQEVLRTATAGAAGGGTQVAGVVPYLTRTGGTTYGVGMRGDNALSRYGLRGRAEYTIGRRMFTSFQFIRQASESGWAPYTSWLRTAGGAIVDSGTVAFEDAGTWKHLTVAPSSFLGVETHGTSNLYQGQLLLSTDDRGAWRVQAGVLDAPVDYSGSPGAEATLADRPGTFSDQQNRGVYASAQWSAMLGTRHQVTAGVDGRYDEGTIGSYPTLDYVDGTAAGSRQTFATGRARTWAGFVQDVITLTDRARLTLGGRVDSWHTYDGASQKAATLPVETFAGRSTVAPTGKAALVYRIVEPTILRLSAGTAFRGPSVYDLYRDTRLSSGRLLLGNPDLDPERMTSWEAGVRQSLGAAIDIDAAYYENRIRSLIYRSVDFAAEPDGGASRNFNAGRARTRGVELSITVRPRAWLTIRPTYTFTDAAITKNDPAPATVGKAIPFVPRHVAAGTVTVSRGIFGVMGTARYQSAVFAVDTNTDTTKGVPGAYDEFAEVDIAASIAVQRHVTVVASAENLFDRRYYLYYRNPGRVWQAGLRVRF